MCAFYVGYYDGNSGPLDDCSANTLLSRLSSQPLLQQILTTGLHHACSRVGLRLDGHCSLLLSIHLTQLCILTRDW